MKKYLLPSIIALMISAVGTAQVSADSTINSNFTELITQSNSFKEYKVVNTAELTRLQELTTERISELKEEIAASEKAALDFKQQIAEANEAVASLEKKLEQVTAEKDAITFLGFPFNKGAYKTVMWGIVAVLVLALSLFVIRYKRSNIHTREARKNLAELEKEFDAYRAKSLEKEQRLGRLLQDEKNKQVRVPK